MLAAVKPVLLKSLFAARDGARPKSIGATEASWYATILASGFRPLSLAAYSDISTKTHAPSFSLLALAGVMVPFFANAGFRPGNLSGINF